MFRGLDFIGFIKIRDFVPNFAKLGKLFIDRCISIGIHTLKPVSVN